MPLPCPLFLWASPASGTVFGLQNRWWGSAIFCVYEFKIFLNFQKLFKPKTSLVVPNSPIPSPQDPLGGSCQTQQEPAKPWPPRAVEEEKWLLG